MVDLQTETLDRRPERKLHRSPILEATASSPLSVPLTIHSPSPAAVGQPITFGLPLPRGLVTAAEHLALFDEQGRLVSSLQARPLARWSDDSIQWLLLDAVLPSIPEGASHWHLASANRASTTPALQLTETDTGVRVAMGVVTFHLSRAALSFARVLRNGQDLLGPGRVVLTDAKGRQGLPQVEKFVVEAGGPLRATFRWEGRFRGRVQCRFVARLCCYAGSGLARMQLTLHNPNRARHSGGLWDLGDPGSMLFRDLSVELGLAEMAGCLTIWSPEMGQTPRSGEDQELEIYQDSSGGENWQSPNHLNRLGQVPCSFRGYRVRAADREEVGLRASPVVALAGAAGTVTVAVPEFWQQFPKAIEVQGSLVRVGFFPKQFGDLFELQGGEQKTHSAWFHFGDAGANPLASLDWVHRPARIQASPEWYADSEALPGLLAEKCDAASEFETSVTQAVSGASSLVARREVIDEYGWRNFGEVHADHEGEYYDGPNPVISHYNNQYDMIYGSLLQYLRTGKPNWFEVFDPLARHVIDIDIYHTKKDKAAYNGGLFWFTDHYKTAATCTHRTYSRHNCQAGDRSYGGGPGSNHNFTTGLLHYYFLTGDPQARDAVLSLANWVVHMDNGARNVLGLVDAGPTGLASATGQLDYHGPGRGAGNSITALLDAWILTRRRPYLDKAESLIRRTVHPADDIDALDLLNVEKRWSYTVFFSTLARYLDLKAEAGELDAAYAYARACLIHYASWMLEHEIPYFDQADRLEYPTEAWAGQELRKANVLRLAAAHADEPARARLLQRAEELADRGWRDLSRFATKTSARSLALVMVEGARDAYFRHQPVRPAPAGSAGHNFGKPERFIPQKTRVLAQLRNPWGLTRALLRLGNPLNWWHWLAR